MKTLVLGGVRSGKTRLAEQLAADSGLDVVYVATAQALDEGMRRRIREHRALRPAAWRTVEEPLHLARALRAHAAPACCLLVDCLTLWLSNLLCAGDEAQFAQERRSLLDSVASLPGAIVLVGNETGLGVVPMGELSRRFVDEAGALHQELAARCERVIFTVAGLPQYLKGSAG